MGVFLNDLKQEFRSSVLWVAWAVISVVVSIAGPFGTYGLLSIGERALFWIPLIGVSVLVAAFVRAFVVACFSPYYTLKGTALTAVLNCLVLVPLLYGVIGVIVPETVRAHVYGAEIAVLVASISLGVCALRISAQTEAAQVQEVAPGASPRLLRRLDPAVSGEIWAISVRDHYVDVQTSRGTGSILMRLSDAMDEVDCREGAQVHRSHWVAWEGVGRVSREGGKVVLHLRNGYQVPVSRNHRAKVDARFPPAPGLKGDAQRGAA